MKKFLSLLFVLMLASSTAMAAEKKSSKSKDKKSVKKEEKKQSYSNSGSEKGSWTVQFQGGLNFIASSTAGTTFTGAGIGGEIIAAYAFNKNFSIGLMTGFEVNDAKPFGPMTGNWTYTPTEVMFQYNFDGSTRPFLFLGLGFANSQFTQHTPGIAFNYAYTEPEFIFSPGIGVAFELSENSSFFVQTRIDILSASADWKSFSSWADSVAIPFQVGVNFSGI